MLRFFRKMNRYRKDFKVDFFGWTYLYLHYPLFLASIHQNSSKPLFRNLSQWMLYWGQNQKLLNHSRKRDGKPHPIPVSFDKVGLANFKEIFLAREYAFAGIPSNIQTFVDAGANKGLASLYFALNYPLKKMLLIEANPLLIPEIDKNVKASFPDLEVEVFNKCLSAQENQILKFYISENSRDSSMQRQSPNQQEVAVESMTMQQLIRCFTGDIDLLKIDVEGAEHELLAEEASAFLKFRHIIAEVHGDRTRCESFENQLRAQGFEVTRIADNVSTYQCEVIFAKRLS